MDSKPHLGLSGLFCVTLALMLLVLPLKWLLAALLAAVIHELFHWLAIRLCGGRMRWIHVGSGGAVMAVEPLTLGKELICALAGPIGGLLLLPLGGYFPRTALCAAFHSLYNLLPIYPLDGGRAVKCAAQLLFPGHADRICRVITVTALCAVWILALWGTFRLGLGLAPLMIAALMVFRSKKYLAKNTQTGYNGLD